jgi:hypothetical protein
MRGGYRFSIATNAKRLRGDHAQTNKQFVLLLIAGIWTVLMLRARRGGAVRRTALVTAGNLLVNPVFFLSRPIFTPYYTIPVAMLSLWSLLSATLIPQRDTVEDSLALRQPVKA